MGGSGRTSRMSATAYGRSAPPPSWIVTPLAVSASRPPSPGRERRQADEARRRHEGAAAPDLDPQGTPGADGCPPQRRGSLRRSGGGAGAPDGGGLAGGVGA